MGSSSLSARVFAVYLFGTGAGLLVAPTMLLGLFGVAAPTEVWVRVLGVVVLALAAYYWTCATDQRFLRTSVWVRPLVLPAFAALVVSAGAPTPLLLFGVVDLLGAVWTGLALRREPAAGSLRFAGRGSGMR